MKNVKEFKEKLNNPEFLKLFSGVKSTKEVAEIAQQNGYDITAEEIEHTTLTDDMLASVAGGKGNTVQVQQVTGDNHGNQTTDPTVSPEVKPSTDVKVSGI